MGSNWLNLERGWTFPGQLPRQVSREGAYKKTKAHWGMTNALAPCKFLIVKAEKKKTKSDRARTLRNQM